MRRATRIAWEANKAGKISIHALLAESDRSADCNYRNARPISIHALLAESDRRGGVSCYLDNIISIHALLAESDLLHGSESKGIKISIHALLAESDVTRVARTPTTVDFYPRSPCGERPIRR